MTEQAGMTQRLAAVLVADVEGYSRRMADDAAATVAALDVGREVFRREVGSRGGSIVDMAGDSVLAVFNLATDAVQAALAVQRALADGGAAATAGAGLKFRIGVHVGELFQKADGSVYGDGVNIAARLESLAPAGGVCISDAVYDAASLQLPIGGVALGVLPQKNIRRPVAAWFVWTRNDAPAEAAARRAARQRRAVQRRRRLLTLGAALLALALLAAAWWMLGRGDAQGTSGAAGASSPIAVLPFADLGSGGEGTSFADGMHEDLLHQLASMGELKVISRTSVLEYRGTRKNLRQVGQELGAGLLLEGSVRRAGAMVRVTAQLIDARTDQHLWSGRYDRELRDLFAIQAELATEIARALRVKLTPAVQARIATRPTADLKAYELYLQAQAMRDRALGTDRIWGELEARIALLDEAVRRDPRFALAWAALAVEHARAYATALDMTSRRQALARESLDRALALQPDDLGVKIAEGRVWRIAFADQERATRAYQHVLDRAPYHVDALTDLSTVLAAQGRKGESGALLERALAVEPHNFRALRLLMVRHRDLREYSRAQMLQQQLIDLRPDDPSLQAEYQQTEYRRTGEWTGYDAWRARQSPGIERQIDLVKRLDIDRATARRDWPEVLRLLDVDAGDTRAAFTDGQASMLKLVRQALVHHALGDKTQARTQARRAIDILDREIAQFPRDASNWFLRSTMSAVLGDSARAHADFGRAADVARQELGVAGAENWRGDVLIVHALLGELDKAQAEAARQARLPGVFVHDWRVSPELASLWDTPAFKALVADPASNAPVSMAPEPQTPATNSPASVARP